MKLNDRFTLAFASLCPLDPASGLSTVSGANDTALIEMATALEDSPFTMWSGPTPSVEQRPLFEEVNKAAMGDFGLSYLPLLLLQPQFDPADPTKHDAFLAHYNRELDYLAGHGITDLTGPLGEPWQGTNTRDVWYPPLRGAALRQFQATIANVFVKLLKGRQGVRLAIEPLCPREHHTINNLPVLLTIVNMINAQLGAKDGRAYVLPDTAHLLWAPHDAPNIENRVDIEGALAALTQAFADDVVFCSHWSYPDVRGAVAGQPLEALMERMLRHTLLNAPGDQIQVVEVFRPELAVIKDCLVPKQTFEPDDYFPLHEREAIRIADIHTAIMQAAA